MVKDFPKPTVLVSVLQRNRISEIQINECVHIPTLRRAIYFTESTNSNANLILNQGTSQVDV